MVQSRESLFAALSLVVHHFGEISLAKARVLAEMAQLKVVQHECRAAGSYLCAALRTLSDLQKLSEAVKGRGEVVEVDNESVAALHRDIVLSLGTTCRRRRSGTLSRRLHRRTVSRPLPLPVSCYWQRPSMSRWALMTKRPPCCVPGAQASSTHAAVRRRWQRQQHQPHALSVRHTLQQPRSRQENPGSPHHLRARSTRSFWWTRSRSTASP